MRPLSLAVAVAAVVLAPACATGPRQPASTSRSAERQHASGVAELPRNPALFHVLCRTTFGPRSGDVETLERIGVAAFLDRQLHPESIDDSRLDSKLASFETVRLSSREIAERYYLPAEEERRRRQLTARPGQPSAPVSPAPRPASPAEASLVRERQVLAELAEQKILRAVESERQLQEVLVDFWFNHFNVFAGKGLDRVYLTEYERDTIRPRVLGRFRDLLGATARSPAMLFYLDNWLSAAPTQLPRPNGQRLGLNENYARELLELHTLGAGGGYTQKDIVEVARAFTGWTIATPRLGGGFTFNPRLHDRGRKVVLGQVIAGGRGQEDGEQVLDILARHPATARFIALKLARRFVADDPPAALVERAAACFRETDGDLREVVRTILTSPEFAAPSARGAKARNPLEFVAAAMRAVGADISSARSTAQALRALGMPLYACGPPAGYGDTQATWINTAALVARMNFAVALSRNRLPGAQIAEADPRIVVDLAAARDRAAAVLGGRGSQATRATLARADDPRDVLALALGAPEFQRR